MIREKDYLRFTTLLHTVAEMAKYQKPSEEAIEGFFRLTKHLSYEEVEKNVFAAYERTGEFPTFPEMVNRKKDEEIIEADYEFAQEMVDQFAFEGFGQTGSTIIAIKLKEAGKEYLMPFINRNAGEIAYSENPTASRAQLKKKLKVYYLEHRQRLIEAKERERLGEQEKKQITDQQKQIEGMIDGIVGKEDNG